MSKPLKGYLRLYQIIGSKKRGISPLIPISEASWHVGVKKGIFPEPIKFGPHTSFYKQSDIEKLIKQIGQKKESVMKSVPVKKKISKTKKAVAKKAAKKAVAKKAIAKKSVVKKSVVKQSVVKQSVVKQSAVKRSVVKGSVVKKSAVKKAVTKKSPIKVAKLRAPKTVKKLKSPRRKITTPKIKVAPKKTVKEAVKV